MKFLVVLSLFALCSAAPKDKRSTLLVSEPTVVVSPSYYSVPSVSHQAYYTSPVVENVVLAKTVPEKTYVGGSAVSQQSRVDVKSYPAVVSEQVVPVVESVPSVVEARYVPQVYSVPAVSQQSRVDVKSSPAVVQHYVSPVHSVVSPSVVSQHVVSPYVSVNGYPTVYAL